MRRLQMAALITLSACGRIGYDTRRPDADAAAPIDRPLASDVPAPPDATRDAAFDAPPADAPPPDSGTTGRACSWASGPPAFGAPRTLGMPNTPSDEFDPVVSHDGLSLYFISYRTNSNDVFVSTRSSTSASFGPGALLGEASTSANETHFFVGPDDLEAFVSSDRAGTTGMSDIFHATRSSSTARWGSFSSLASVSSPNGDFDAHLDGDGLTLWLAPIGRPGGAGMQDLFFAPRADGMSPFSTPLPAGTLNSTANEWDDSLSDDGLVIVFDSDRGGSLHTYYATRRSRADAFGPPALLTALEPYVSTLRDPFLAPNGCDLYFAMTQTGGAGGIDLYVIEAP